MVKQISIPCFKTILDALDKNSRYNSTSKLFFSTLATESRKNRTIRTHYGIITKPVFTLLYEIIYEIYNEYEKDDSSTAKEKIIKKLDVIEAILAGLDYDIFELDMPHKESVFEMARLLNDEEGIEINLVSNNHELQTVQKTLIEKDAIYKEFEILDTEKWISKHISRSQK